MTGQRIGESVTQYQERLRLTRERDDAQARVTALVGALGDALNAAAHLARGGAVEDVREVLAQADAVLRAEFAAHRADDPHCTCNDCLDWHERHLDASGGDFDGTLDLNEARLSKPHLFND